MSCEAEGGSSVCERAERGLVVRFPQLRVQKAHGESALFNNGHAASDRCLSRQVHTIRWMRTVSVVVAIAAATW
jgi:hypothetical protein